jgi:hypothetical protein
MSEGDRHVSYRVNSQIFDRHFSESISYRFNRLRKGTEGLVVKYLAVPPFPLPNHESLSVYPISVAT